MNKTIYHKYPVLITVLVLFSVVSFAHASHKGPYPVKSEHQGIDIKPGDAYEIIEKDRKNAFIVDVRTRFEYQDIGHAGSRESWMPRSSRRMTKTVFIMETYIRYVPGIPSGGNDNSEWYD